MRNLILLVLSAHLIGCETIKAAKNDFANFKENILYWNSQKVVYLNN